MKNTLTERDLDFVQSHLKRKLNAEELNFLDSVSKSVSAIKEKADFSLSDATNGIQRAISIYYESLLNYVVDQFKELYENTPKKKLPNVQQEMPIVVSGGTSLVGGFIDRLTELTSEGFPVPISEVKHAKEPLFAVANGLYQAAKIATNLTEE